ncbi:hypothetical protein BV25DRAFT_1339674 [Artomyces pyxidatus]|uniref:Uncharacterized protein n=1 Tax=Artomyces pyxidatus TaxID=48021 RepID=A0ACB8SMX1_9AGAM|nr:hypothetical protein BV25DRAFT_1339674 [Artomyces pyxidatus]
MSLQGVRVPHSQTLSVLAPFLFPLDTLSTIEVDHFIPFENSLDHAVDKNIVSHASRITSITCYTVAPASTLKLFTGLEELIIHYLPNSSFKLPPTVRHFGIHLATWVGDSFTWDVLAASVIPHPSLKLVTVTPLDDGKLAPLAPLVHACREHGVDFVVHPNVWAFPRMQYVDWLP